MRRIACVAFCLFLAGAASAAEKSPDELLDAAIDYAKTHKQPLPKLVSFCKKLILAGRLIRAETIMELICRQDIVTANKLARAIEKSTTILGKWSFNTAQRFTTYLSCDRRGRAMVISRRVEPRQWGTWKRIGKATFRLRRKAGSSSFVVKVRGKCAEGRWTQYPNRDFRGAAIRGKRIR